MVSMRQVTLALSFILAHAGFCQALEGLNVVHEWKYIDYKWANDSQKEDAIASGLYNYTEIHMEDVLPRRVGDEMIACPKTFHDNPASVCIVSSESGPGGPLLEPYPSWDWHRSDASCSERIVSVERMLVDRCDRVWMVDNGKIADEQVCLPKILAFDQKTDEVLVNFEIPIEVVWNSTNNDTGRLKTAVVETEGDSCEQTWVYMSDFKYPGLAMWNGTKAWRLPHDRAFDPGNNRLEWPVSETKYTYNINALEGMALAPNGYLQKPAILLKCLCCTRTNLVSTDDLHNSWWRNVTYYRAANVSAFDPEPAKSWASNGVLCASYSTLATIACYNLERPLSNEVIDGHSSAEDVAADNKTMQFVSSLKMSEYDAYENHTNIELWAMSNKFLLTLTGTMNFTVGNFRTFRNDVDKLVNGTGAQPWKTHATNATFEEKNFFVITESDYDDQ